MTYIMSFIDYFIWHNVLHELNAKHWDYLIDCIIEFSFTRSLLSNNSSLNEQNAYYVQYIYLYILYIYIVWNDAETLQIVISY